MALTSTDRDCLEACLDYLLKVQLGRKLSTDESTHLQSIKTGEEVDRVAAAKWYAEDVALVTIQDQLDVIDQRKTDLESEKTTLEAYIA